MLTKGVFISVFITPFTPLGALSALGVEKEDDDDAVIVVVVAAVVVVFILYYKLIILIRPMGVGREKLKNAISNCATFAYEVKAYI